MPANPALHAECLVYPDPAFCAGCFCPAVCLNPLECGTLELLQAELTAVAGLIYFHGVEPLRPNRPLVYGAGVLRNNHCNTAFLTAAVPVGFLKQRAECRHIKGVALAQESDPACRDDLRN